ncbi:hypothetical protein HMPREF9069_01464 [Atopobium sp. oral taxon 810 str. F0209]|nr:hypothetical protein HMPREF9069_01464 [Atopobium sp. oral taxon 810 str. F0209]
MQTTDGSRMGHKPQMVQVSELEYTKQLVIFFGRPKDEPFE